MDDVFDRVEGRFRVSLVDSTMMWIVHQAMNKAHERAQYKEGVIECLTEISKFYELALMQLEGCLKFVNEELDSSFESSDEEVLGDLADIRDRIVGRLKESELAIAEKDRELAKLRKALESKERQLESLDAKLMIEPAKNEEGVEELMHGRANEHIAENQASADEDREGGFSGLKHSLEQQVLNIKQKLEPESEYERKRYMSCDNLTIKQMSSDIDILKETMDIAFGKMQSTLFLSEMEPLEQQWRLAIEKDALSIAMKGFMLDVQDNFRAEVKGRQIQVSCGLNYHLTNLLEEMKCLHDKLEPLCLSESNPEGKNNLKPRGKSPAEEDNRNPSRSEEDQGKQQDGQDDGGNYVAKLIKNHESIIKRKKKEQNWLKRENPEEKETSNARREEELAISRRRIQDVIERMQELVNWNAKLGENFEDDEGSFTATLCNFRMTKQEEPHIENSEKMNKISISMTDAGNEKLHDEIRTLKEEKEDANLQAMIDAQIREEINCIILRKAVKDARAKISCLEDYNLEGKIRDDVCKIFLREICKEWNEFVKGTIDENLVMKEGDQIALEKSLRDIRNATDNNISKIEEMNLREEISTFLFGEVYKEWKEVIERSDDENVVREGRYHIAIQESPKNLANTGNCLSSKHGEVENPENCMYGFPLNNESFQLIEHSVKEDVYKIFLKEISEEWKKETDAHNLECVIMEEIFFLTVVEAIKEANTAYRQTVAQDQFKINRKFFLANKLHGNQLVSDEETLINNEDLHFNSIKLEEDLIQRASSDSEECNENCSPIQLEHENLDKLKTSRDVFTEMESACTSMRSKVEHALEQLTESNAIVNKLRSRLGVAGEDQITSVASEHNTKPSWLQQNENNRVKLTASYSTLTPFIEFSRIFMDFKCIVEEKIELNILRFEEAMLNLNSLSDLVSRRRRVEMIYRKAFICRCQNLKKAETEVDLLGNQVEVLFVLLEKIYNTLHHYSPELKNYFEVSDILKLIKEEIRGEVHGSSTYRSQN